MSSASRSASTSASLIFEQDARIEAQAVFLAAPGRLKPPLALRNPSPRSAAVGAFRRLSGNRRPNRSFSSTLSSTGCAEETRANLLYVAIGSLDGYIADAEGIFDWAVPDEEMHAYVDDPLSPIGTYLYGRRMSEVMAPWKREPALSDHASPTQEFARM